MASSTPLDTPHPSSPSSGISTPNVTKPSDPSNLPSAASIAAAHHASPPPLSSSRRRGWLAHMRDDISLTHADWPLLVSCLVSGLCDSVAFNATGTFASMQTGNTIFLALGAASLPPNQPLLWLRALVSISSFWAGCLFFSRAFKTHHPRPLQKLTLALSFALQGILILAAAALSQTAAVPAFAQARLPPTLDAAAEHARLARENDAVTLAPLALLAFGFGGQIVASRVLGFTEVPTNVLTSLYCDLLSDPGLAKGVGRNEKRDRRVVAIVMMLGGGVVGGWMQRTGAGMSGALWLAAGIKMGLAGAWLGWKSREMVVEEGKGDV
ncbi:hypothetical protein B0T18DRAFT_323031 [Schizothecium vesticola]|uniref:DUF1275 domain protein n=1 Tax=Schizothecium vesticola TaxID=314040 RepID=A0AA40K7K8_9PEZI|nr:hypothetical protein B0T18DRAFT_323031 [Schizothecium vesticola]